MTLDFVTPNLHALQAQFRADGFDIRLVGGCVRDWLAGHEPKDIDLCTNAYPDEQIALYRKLGLRFIPTGYDHGTITVVLDDTPYEITSLRLDVATDGRRATVAYTRDWLADLKRRDLTINAMSMDFEGKLFDPFNGAEHLKKGIVKFVGNPNKRIQEDYLRILRWFRFQVRFGIADTEKMQKSAAGRAISRHKDGLKKISKERIWSEIKALLQHENGPLMLAVMDHLGVGECIGMPAKVKPQSRLASVYAARKALEWSGSPEVIIAAWFGWYEPDVLTIANDWKWSNAEKEHFYWLLRHGWLGCDLRRLIAVHNAPREWVRELAHWEGRNEWEKTALVEWVFPPFPVNGNDLIAYGIKPGKIMGVIINTLKDKWAASGYSATKDDLMQMVIDMDHEHND